MRRDEVKTRKINVKGPGMSLEQSNNEQFIKLIILNDYLF